MHLPDYLSTFPFITLYAETHFRFFRFFPSLLFKRQPEVIFDAPRRLEPGEDLPVLLIANDLLRFPSEFTDCAIAVSWPHATPKRFDFPDITPFEVKHPFRCNMRAFIIRIPRTKLPSGLIYITCRVTVKCGQKQTVVINDNLPTTRKLSFVCFIADHHLPGSEFCSYGDLHMHSQYSRSHVEFGPPLDVIEAMANASGLSFIAVTDHSYDLSCSMENYLVPDPGLKSWLTFQEEMVNRGKKGSVLITGEEISCLNGKKEVIHLCGLNLSKFIPGSLDGARKNRYEDRQLTLMEVINTIHEQKGIAIAAHPGVHQGLLQRLFLYRGEWTDIDSQSDIDAMQIFNNGFSPSFNNGKRLWINMLQRGYKVPVVAGNDAHGDFNRYRALLLPFVSIKENNYRFMGCGKTGIYGKCQSVDNVMEGIRDGKTFITTGPFAAISFTVSPADSIIGKKPISSDVTTLFIQAISTPEFGPVRTVDVYAGERGNPPEKKIFSRYYADTNYHACEKIALPLLSNKLFSYLRLEISCRLPGNAESRAVSSAAFLK
jgi:histidinol phosphatase-like PHP family hydrolase